MKKIIAIVLPIVALLIATITPAYAVDAKSVTGVGVGTIFSPPCSIGAVPASITFSSTRAAADTTGAYTITSASITITGTISGLEIKSSSFQLHGVVSSPSCEGPGTGVLIAGTCGTGVTITYVELFVFGATGTFTGTVTCTTHS